MLRDVASSIGVSHKNVCTVLKQELHMSKVLPDLVPKVLMEEQKAERVCIALDCLHEEEIDSILERTITRHESSVFEYNLVKKRASMVWLRSDKLCQKSSVQQVETQSAYHRFLRLARYAAHQLGSRERDSHWALQRGHSAEIAGVCAQKMGRIVGKH